MRVFRAVFVLATLATLWLAPITSPTGELNQAGVAHADTGPIEPPLNEQDTTTTQDSSEGTSSVDEPVPGESSFVESFVAFLISLIP